MYYLMHITEGWYVRYVTHKGRYALYPKQTKAGANKWTKLQYAAAALEKLEASGAVKPMTLKIVKEAA